MEKGEARAYKVELTGPANRSFAVLADRFDSVLSPERANESVDLLLGKLDSLERMPNRGSREPVLSGLPQVHRYLLFEWAKRKQVKIIYYVDESMGKVYVTDFFPTSGSGKEMLERNL